MDSTKIRHHKLKRCPACTKSVEMQGRGLAFHKNSATGRVCSASLTNPSNRGNTSDARQKPLIQKTRTKKGNSLDAQIYPLQTSAICTVCEEEHRVTAEGLMSIHRSLNHARCPGSPSTEQIQASKRPWQPALEADSGRRPNHRKNQRRQSPKKQHKRKSLLTKYQTQIERAVTEAISKPKGSHSGKIDRRIYAVSGVHFVSGGSPSLKRRR